MHVRMIRRSICTFASALAVTLVASGCIVRVPADTTDGSRLTVPATIEVRLVNDTDRPLDPQIYVAGINGSLEDLFSPANKQTKFGVGSLGTMLPKSETSLTLTCDETGYFGTLGGIFGEDLESPDGSGRQVVLQENINVECGDVVTFWFENAGNTLITTYAVTLQGTQ